MTCTAVAKCAGPGAGLTWKPIFNRASPEPLNVRLRCSMSGNSTGGFEVQARDVALLQRLAELRVATVEHLRIGSGFNSRSRLGERLKKMEQAGLIRQDFVGTIQGGRRAIYALTKAGAVVGNVPYRPYHKR